jgi:hypothetical protein
MAFSLPSEIPLNSNLRGTQIAKSSIVFQSVQRESYTTSVEDLVSGGVLKDA